MGLCLFMNAQQIINFSLHVISCSGDDHLIRVSYYNLRLQVSVV